MDKKYAKTKRVDKNWCFKCCLRHKDNIFKETYNRKWFKKSVFLFSF